MLGEIILGMTKFNHKERWTLENVLRELGKMKLLPEEKKLIDF